MYIKVSQKILYSGLNKLVEKHFIRNSKGIKTKTATYNGKVYYREWNIEENSKKITKYSRSYSNNKLIPHSQSRIDYKA